jgi:hypothetical protein
MHGRSLEDELSGSASLMHSRNVLLTLSMLLILPPMLWILQSLLDNPLLWVVPLFTEN